MNKVPLSKVARFINGRAFKPEEWHTVGLPIIRIQNLTGTSEESNYYNGKYDERNLVKRGDILISWSASLGVYEWQGKDAILNQHIFKVLLNDSVDKRYFYHAATDLLIEMSSHVHGSTMQHITKDKFDALEIPLPKPDEQKRIAANLDNADRLRRQRRFAQILSGSFLQSVFIKMFGEPLSNSMNWKTELLGKLFSIPPHIGTITPAENEGEQLCVRVGEVGDDYIDLKNCHHVSLTGNDLKRFSLHFGDIVLARAIGSESHLGKLSVMSQSSKPVVFDSHLMRLRLNNSLLITPFFTQLLRTKGGRARFMKQARRTAVQFNINGEQISEIEIPLPPLPLQEKFAAIVQKFERVRRQQHEATRQAENLFQSLLHRAFRGEL